LQPFEDSPSGRVGQGREDTIIVSHGLQ
jgi:hypothetical protein